jgi:aminocarboxymuconate-semialdehyde decarboxylase
VPIDVHAHHYPRKLVDLMTALGSRSVAAVNGAGAEITLEERLQLLQRNGIAQQVLSVGILAPDFTNREHAITAARLANDLYATACRAFPGRLAAFGAVPLPHADAAVNEARRCLDDLGMLGITLGCSIAGRPLDDPAFAPLFAELDRYAAVVFLHPVGAGTGPHTTDFGLPWMIGAVFEDTIAALRLVLSGMTTRYPRLRVIVPHLGGTAPFLLDRLEYYLELERRKGNALYFHGGIREQLRGLWYDTVNLQPAALRCAVDAFGADRLLLGTDFPFLSGTAFCSCVRYVEEAGLTPSQHAAILTRNASLLLGLNEPRQHAEGARP